ncbi:MAG TPA: GyrI-like domain-containing protein [Hanamia sp.]|nr:GyrI-like domain-containing protein [Hanamia sp.]
MNKSNVISGYLYNYNLLTRIFRKMKKWVVAILVIIVLIAIGSFYPITQNSTINISATFENTILQVIHIDNWKNWYPEVKKAYETNPADYSIKKDSSQKIYTITIPGRKINIHQVTPMSYEVNEVGGAVENNFAFTVFPGGSHKMMKIFLVRKAPLIYSLFRDKNIGENTLQGLKYYLETPKELYGFDIKMSEIRDPVIASSVFKTKKGNIFIKIQGTYNELMQYLKENKLIKTGHVSISYIPIMGDSLQVTVGVPVNKSAPSGKEIKCLSLPAKGRVLVGNYDGKFSDRQKIYNAMTKYLTDHNLAIPAESFERYLNDSIPTSESSEIRMELDYPVY